MAKTDYGDVEEGVSMTQEVTRKNRKHANVPGSGLYRHPESGQEAIVQSDPLWGNTQAQAFARLGFKFVREANEGEIVTLPELAADARKQEEGTLKGLSARLDALENVAAENKSLTSEIEELRAKLDAETKAREEAEKAAADAQQQIKSAGEAATPGAVAKSADGAKENAQDATEAREQASGNTQGAVAVDKQQKADQAANKTTDKKETK